jgi:hypothetical protein
MSSSDANAKIYEKYWCNLKQLIELGIFFAKDINDQHGCTKIDIDDLELAKAVLNEIKPEKSLLIFEKFIETSYPHWQKILERDRIYFIENADSILSAYTKIGAEYFKILFTTKSADNPELYAIDGDDADEVWDYLVEFVKMSIRHVHMTRSPTIHRENNSVRIVYANQDYMSKIDIIKWSQVYEINLTWV